MSAALGFWVSKLIVKGFGSVKASHLTLWSKSAVTFTAELQPNYTTANVSSSYPLKNIQNVMFTKLPILFNVSECADGVENGLCRYVVMNLYF